MKLLKIMLNNVGKMSTNYSPNFDLQKRDKKNIKYIIYHYTGMKSDRSAIRKLTNFNSKVSCHYYIDKSGNLIQLVPDLYIAWHAGKSYWKNSKLLNKSSIGIEISNPGHEHGYKTFKIKQIKCLIKISKLLIKKYKIKKQNILGHSDISPDRKKDPGEKFPWHLLAKSKLCFWHKLKQKNIKKFRRIKLSLKERSEFLINLKKIGYSNFNHKNSKSNRNLTYNIIAFQRRFRPNLINGIIDSECLLISRDILRL